MPPGKLDGGMKRREALHEHLALDVATTGAAGHLREQLKRALARAEIGNVQAEVRVNDADQRDIFEVQALRNHLRSHEDVRLPRLEISEHAAVVLLALHQVRVHPLHPRVREQFGQRLLHPLGAEAGVADRCAPALGLGTSRGGGRLVAADVAADFLRAAVVGERDAAIGALGHVAALRTLERTGIAAAVQKKHRLLAAFQSLGDRLLELDGKNRNALFLAGLLPHVHHAHDGHLLFVGADRELQQGVFGALDVVKALHGRRGGAEDHDGILHLAAHHRHIARVVTGGFLLLVGMLVFLIHNDQAERLDGSEDGRTRADHDAGAALADLVPLIVSLTGAEVRVEHGDLRLQRAVAEARLEALHGLRRERDFRHEHHRAFALRERVGDGLEIHLRLAGAGDAVEEEGGR